MRKVAFRKLLSIRQITLIILCLIFFGEMANAQVVATVFNRNDVTVKDVVICLNDKGFLSWMNSSVTGNLEIVCNKEKLVWQKIDNNGDGKIECLLVQTTLGANETKKLVIKQLYTPFKSLTKKTQAELSIKEGGEWKKVTKEDGKEQFEYIGGTFKNVQSLRVPENHTDHSFYIRYEGPGWESDKIGYRFYLDWRNAIDLFGKKTSEMVLQNVGQDGFESYHNESDWGMDVLKVGASLGLGTFGYWNGQDALRVATTDSIFCKITDNGTLKSEITTNYYGWKDAGNTVNLTSQLSILAGSRLTRVDLSLSDTLPNLCTGIVKLDAGELIQYQAENSEWSYIATFGQQSLNNDMLGLVVFYRVKDIVKVTSDSQSHVVVLKPENKHLAYYLGATWEKDSDGIKTKESFIDYLNSTIKILNNPVSVSFK